MSEEEEEKEKEGEKRVDGIMKSVHTCARCHVHHAGVMLSKLNVQSIVNEDL